MLTATTTTADSQAHYALAPDLVAAPRQNNRHLPRPVKRRLQILLVESSALGGFTQRPGRTKAFGLAAVRRFAQRRLNIQGALREPVIRFLSITNISKIPCKFPALC